MTLIIIGKYIYISMLPQVMIVTTDKAKLPLLVKTFETLHKDSEVRDSMYKDYNDQKIMSSIVVCRILMAHLNGTSTLVVLTSTARIGSVTQPSVGTRYCTMNWIVMCR